MIGIGNSKNVDTLMAAQECAFMAQAALHGQPPGWGIAFCGGRHQSESFLAKTQEIVGKIPLIGGGAVGTITAQLIGYSGFETSLALFPATLEIPTLLIEEGLSGQEFVIGQWLGRQLRKLAPDNATVLLFYDSVDVPPPSVRLHVGTWLLKGIYEELQSKPIHLVGAGTLSHFDFSAVSYVFAGQTVKRHTAVIAILPPTLDGHTRIFHGCIPASAFLTITRMEGATIYTLDEQPALDVLQTIVGEEAFVGSSGQPILSVTLGEKHGDIFAPYDEGAYANRLILAHDPRERSITLFEPDFHVGAKVQVMLRSNQLMQDSVKKGMAALLHETASMTPLLGLYINCAGRSSFVSGADTEEAALVATGVTDRFPLLGFYSGVEIAPVQFRSQAFDWTGVLTVLCQTPVPPTK